MHLANYQPKIIFPDVPDLTSIAYDRGLKIFIERFFEDISGHAAIYQFGKIRTWGISDIDLLIIVDDAQWKRARQKIRSIIASSDLLKLLFLHEPVTIGISALEFLQALHTMENCRFIHGNWNPVPEKIMPGSDFETSLISHAAWNSFMRIAALELNAAQIGLRRTLVLIHNLLKSAKYGNNFLPNPISIPVTSEEIRSSILSKPLEKQESLTRLYINEIISILNTVDAEIDASLKLSSSDVQPYLPIACGRHFLITFSTRLKQSEKLNFAKLLNNTCFVKMPTYLIEMASIISAELSNKVPALRRFKLGNGEKSDRSHGYLSYIYNLKNAVNVCLQNGINDFYFLPLPFACQKIRLSLKSKIISKIRRKLLSSVLIFE